MTTARALKTCPDPDVAGHLRLSRATIRNFLGQWKAMSRAQPSHSFDDFEHSDDRRLLAQAHLLAEWCCTCLGLPERAEHERAALDASDRARRLDRSRQPAPQPRRERLAGEPGATTRSPTFAASAEHYERAGDVLGAAIADNNLAEILTLQFHLDAPEQLLVASPPGDAGGELPARHA